MIIATEGIIPQVERFASKFVFNRLNVRLFEKALSEMANKADNAEGNTFVCVCNRRMYDEVQRTLGSWLRDWKTDGAFIWSKGQNNYVKVGTAFNSYTWGNNTLIFKQDRSLDIEFPNKAYGLILDLTTDANGVAGLMMFTFKGGELIHNVVRGVGGISGLESGEVSSPVAGSKISRLSR